MLESNEWSRLGALWDESTRQELNLVWHRLKGQPPSLATVQFTVLSPS